MAPRPRAQRWGAYLLASPTVSGKSLLVEARDIKRARIELVSVLVDCERPPDTEPPDTEPPDTELNAGAYVTGSVLSRAGRFFAECQNPSNQQTQRECNLWAFSTRIRCTPLHTTQHQHRVNTVG